MFESGFHRLAFFFGLASVAVWTYVFNEWWGGEWWGLLLAVAAAIPVGIVFSILPSILLGERARGVRVIAFEGTTLAMVSLTVAELLVSGIGLLYTRLNAMRYQAAIGEASEDGVRFLEEIDRMR